MKYVVVGSLLFTGCSVDAPSSIPPADPVDPAALEGRTWRMSDGSFRGHDLGDILARTGTSVLLRVDAADDTSFAFDLVLEGPGPDRACVFVTGEGSLDPALGVGRGRLGSGASGDAFELVWGSEASEVRARSSGPTVGADCPTGADDSCGTGAGAEARFEQVEEVPELELPPCDIYRSDDDDDDEDDDDEDDDHPFADVLEDIEIVIDVGDGEIHINCSSIGQRSGAMSLVALSLAGLLARRRSRSSRP